MQMILVGYGTIGRVKANIWRSLGINVVVHDVNQESCSQAVADGFHIYDLFPPKDEYIIDISTPAGHHFSSLTSILASASDPHAILIEKPLASTEYEIIAFRNFANTARGKVLAHRIFVNESYASSPAIAAIQSRLAQNNESIERIEIELSKNRLSDNNRGRFFDSHLNAIGHEVPHMLVVLQMFSFDITQSLRAGDAVLYADKKYAYNEAFTLTSTSEGASIRLISCLGNFKIHDGNITENEGLTRYVNLVTDKARYKLWLDPAPNLPRYTAKLDVYLSDKLAESAVIPDNHLKLHLIRLLTMRDDEAKKSLYGFENGLLISETLITMRQQCKSVALDSLHISRQDQ